MAIVSLVALWVFFYPSATLKLFCNIFFLLYSAAENSRMQAHSCTNIDENDYMEVECLSTCMNSRQRVFLKAYKGSYKTS